MEVHVHHLRRKLGSEFIRTVHGIGGWLHPGIYEIGRNGSAQRQADAIFPGSSPSPGNFQFCGLEKDDDNVDELFDTQLMLFARRLSTLDLNEINAALCSAWRIRQRN